jgi:hypothetical protein
LLCIALLCFIPVRLEIEVDKARWVGKARWVRSHLALANHLAPYRRGPSVLLIVRVA